MRFSIDFSKAFFVLLRYSFPIWGGIAVLISLIGWLVSELEETFSLNEALYFAWVTGTTVGYGDLVPTTGITRFLAILVALLGIVFTGIIVAMAIEAAKIAVDKNSSLQAFIAAAEESTEKRIMYSKTRDTKGQKEEQ